MITAIFLLLIIISAILMDEKKTIAVENNTNDDHAIEIQDQNNLSNLKNLFLSILIYNIKLFTFFFRIT